MREILSSISRLSIPTILNLTSSVLKNKILALIIGPAGVGIYSQVMNVTAIVSAVLPVGSVGLVNYVSNYYDKKEYENVTAIISYFLKHNFIISLLLSGIFLIFNKYISGLIFASENYFNLILMLAIFIPFNLFVSFLDIYLKGIRLINKYVLFLSVNAVVSTLVTLPLIYFWEISGAIAGMLISSILSIVTGLTILKKSGINSDVSLLKSKKPDSVIIKNIYKLGTAALITMVLQNVTILIIKSVMAEKMSIGNVGIFQSVYSISTAYFGIFFSLVGSYCIPKIATLKTNLELTDELNNTIKLLLLVYTPVIVTIFILRVFLINLLYTPEFITAKFLLVFQLPAELIRALSWVIGLWLIPNVKVKQWIIFDTTFCICFLSMFYILIQNGYDIESASMAYLIAYSLYFIINFVYAFNSIKFRFSFHNIQLLAITAFIFLCVYYISNYDEMLGIYLLIPVLGIWGFLSVKKDDMRKAMDIVKSKINKK